MTTDSSLWRQMSSYRAQGDACIHVARHLGSVHLTESGDPKGTVLGTTPPAWAALLRSVKAAHPHDRRAQDRPAHNRPAVGLTWSRAAPEDAVSPGPGSEIACGPGDLVHLRETDAPGTVVTTTRTGWDAFTQDVRAGEFDHFAEPDHPGPRSPHPVTAPGEHRPVRESDDDLSP